MILPETLRAYLKSCNLYFSRSFSEIGRVFEKFRETVVFSPDNKLYSILVHDETKFVTVGAWTYSLALTWLLRVRVTGNKFSKTVRNCHVGQELVKPTQDFIFLPPRNPKLLNGLHRLLQSGIYQRWEYEANSLLHSKRVQDRVRVKSSTKMSNMHATSIPAQGLEGKVVTMFLLWCVCIAFSLTVLWCEVLNKHCKTIKNKKISKILTQKTWMKKLLRKNKITNRLPNSNSFYFFQ